MDYKFMEKVSEDIQAQKEIEKAKARRKAKIEQERTDLAYSLIYISIIIIGCFGAIAIANAVFQR